MPSDRHLRVRDRSSRWWREPVPAGKLSRMLRDGDSRAAFRLKQRQHALKGVSRFGWEWRLALANEARKRYRNERKVEQAKQAALQPYMLSDRDL